jgi:TolB-like protein
LPRFQALQARFDADPRFNPKVRPLNATLEPITNADDRSVAVLAFANLSYDKANEYFSDGISEELLNVLAKVPGLKVTARTSAFHFKGKDTPIPEIAKQLGVAYVVEGSVRKAGDKVRITAQLIKAADGFHVWSDTFTRDLKDVFAVQDEIAGLIAQNLSLKLSDTPRAAKPVNPAAFDLFLEARQYVATVSVANFTRAETLYLKALEIDPDFTRAAAGLAVLRATRALNRCIPSRYMEPELADIERAARDILRRDANVGEAHAALGLVLAGRGQNSEAEAAFAEAGRLGFNREQASHMLAFSLFRSGRPDLAITAMEEARRVNPLAWTPIDVGGLGHLFTRRYARAAEAFQAAARANGAPVTHSNLALALIGLGRNEEAVAAARQALAVPNRADWQPGFLAWSDGLAAWALAQAGARSEAEAVVRRLLAGPVESRYAANYALIELGRLDEAAPTLEDQGGNHGYLFFFLNERPALLADTHIARLLEKLRAVEDFETFRRIVTEQSVPQ